MDILEAIYKDLGVSPTKDTVSINSDIPAILAIQTFTSQYQSVLQD